MVVIKTEAFARHRLLGRNSPAFESPAYQALEPQAMITTTTRKEDVASFSSLNASLSPVSCSSWASFWVVIG